MSGDRPLAGRVAPWWTDWAATLGPLGVREVTLRARVALPPFVAETDRATGLRHSELRARLLLGPFAT